MVEMSDLSKEEIEAYHQCAYNKYLHLSSDGDVDFDDYPVIAPSDDGAYVQSWLWVSKEEMEYEKDHAQEDGIRE